MESILLFVALIAIAAFGAWETTRCRHRLETERRRRRDDP